MHIAALHVHGSRWPQILNGTIGPSDQSGYAQLPKLRYRERPRCIAPARGLSFCNS